MRGAGRAASAVVAGPFPHEHGRWLVILGAGELDDVVARQNALEGVDAASDRSGEFMLRVPCVIIFEPLDLLRRYCDLPRHSGCS